MSTPNRAGLDDRSIALMEMLKTETQPQAGRLLGLPELPEGDYWVDIAGATALLDVPPRTISSWLARRRPRKHPFPQPNRILYRLYWRASVLRRWQDKRVLDA